MGLTSSSEVKMIAESVTDPVKKAQIQELQDICSNYLEHFEFILESSAIVKNKREVLMVLKSNCQTAREQISKLPTKTSARKYYSSPNHNTNDTEHEPCEDTKQRSKSPKTDDVPEVQVLASLGFIDLGT
eukprot:187274_1